jgi:hypothetical protein
MHAGVEQAEWEVVSSRAWVCGGEGRGISQAAAMEVLSGLARGLDVLVTHVIPSGWWGGQARDLAG